MSSGAPHCGKKKEVSPFKVKVNPVRLDGDTLEIVVDSQATVGQILACLKDRVDSSVFQAYKQHGKIVLLDVKDAVDATWELKYEETRAMRTKFVRSLVDEGLSVTFQLLLTQARGMGRSARRCKRQL